MIAAKVWEEAGGRVFTTDQGEVRRDDPDDPMRTGMRKMARVMYELDRRLVVARLRRGRRLKAERGGFAGGGVRYGFTTERKQLVPDQAEGEVARRIRRLHRGGLSIRKIADQLNSEVSGETGWPLASDHGCPGSAEGVVSSVAADEVRRPCRSLKAWTDPFLLGQQDAPACWAHMTLEEGAAYAATRPLRKRHGRVPPATSLPNRVL